MLRQLLSGFSSIHNKHPDDSQREKSKVLG
ncbi:BnaCnng60570D [Brassica napus]|uniref:BnaCnng60570D protein n=1 Tax=Brassica napus TaxID=3708 RepID=A0A078JPV1_BRANA|nr:BnaCnng60570D [Brassica napus]